MSSKIITFFAAGLFAASGYGHPGHSSALEIATVQSVTMYAKTFGLEFDKPTKHFVGFSSTKNDLGFDVEVFHADDFIDILVNQYGCTSNSMSGAECGLVSQYPRCFYYADAGRFSISDFGIAIGHGIHALLDEGVESDAITTLKVWQNGRQVISKFSYEKAGTGITKTYACDESDSVLICIEIGFQPPNEP